MKHRLIVETLEVESFPTAMEIEAPGTARELCPTFCFTQCRTACSCPVTY